MKKIFKISVILVVFLVLIPSLAGWAIMMLWNSTLSSLCGFSVINFWQSVGLFFLGQIMSGGFAFGMFLVGGTVHRLHHSAVDWHRHWHGMTDSQRREFIENRRREHFGFRNRTHEGENAAE